MFNNYDFMIFEKGTIMQKEKVLSKLVYDMVCFLDEHRDSEFYALALDCNMEYATFLVCMNTPENFASTLKQYQAKYTKYTEEKWIRKLRYNPGDWKYRAITEVNLFEEDELTARYQDDIDRQCEEMKSLCNEILCDFRQTEAFERIPKTPDFITFCIDHDEDVDSALERQIRL